MTDFTVVTAFRARDQMSKDMKKMGLSIKDFGRITERAFNRTAKAGLSMRKMIGGILGASIIQRGVGALATGVGSLVEEFIEFDHTITAASAAFGEFDRESQTFKDLAKSARDVAAITEFNAPQAAKGLEFLAKAGWSVNDSMKAMPSFVDLATASQMEFDLSSSIAADTMGAFGLVSENSEERLANLITTNDILTKSVNASNIDLEELFDTVKMAGPIARTSGVSLAQFGAMTAFVGNAGIKSTMAGTALRTMFLALVNPTEKARAVLDSFGVKVLDSKDNMKDPIKLLGELTDRFEKLGTGKRAALLETLFGKYAVSGAAVSIAGAKTGLLEFDDSMKNAEGTAKKTADMMRSSLKNRVEELKSTVLEAGFTILDVFKNKFPGGIDAATAAIRKFDAKTFANNLKTVATSLLTIVNTARDFVKWGDQFRGLIFGIGVAFATWQLASIVTGLIGVYKFITLIKATGGISSALMLVGVGPMVALITLAVGGLAAGIYTVVTNWEDLKRAIGWLVDDAGTALTGLGTKIASVFHNIGMSILSGFFGIIKKIMSLGSALGLNKLSGFAAMDAGIKALDTVVGGGSSRGAGVSSSRGGSPGAAGSWGSPAADANLKTVAKQSQQHGSSVNFTGQLDITGAPAGSTLQTKTTGKGAPPVRAQLLGANR